MNGTKTMTTQEVARRYHELAKLDKWFELQDELFADDVDEPADATGRSCLSNSSIKSAFGAQDVGCGDERHGCYF